MCKTIKKIGLISKKEERELTELIAELKSVKTRESKRGKVNQDYVICLPFSS